mgnify:CR=1 FL=1
MGCAKRLVRPRPVRGVSLTQVPFARTATFFAEGGAMSSEPMFYVNKKRKKERRRTVAAAVASEAAAFSSGYQLVCRHIASCQRSRAQDREARARATAEGVSASGARVWRGERRGLGRPITCHNHKGPREQTALS